MSAVNVILREHAVYAITDGAAHLRADSRVASTSRPKVLPLPHLRGVLLHRGCPTLFASLYGVIVHRRSLFDEACDELGRDFCDLWNAHAQKMPPAAVADVMEVALAGWPDDPSEPARCTFAVNQSRYGREAFQPINLDMLMSPDQDGALTDAFGRERLMDRTAPFDPETEGLALVDAQRRIPGVMVGGFCQLTTITREAITTKMLARWGDEAA